MTDDHTRLNIERARAALARARMDEVAAAVRAPRPADLSRLQEDHARAETLNDRASAFRSTVRERLGLSAYSGPITLSQPAVAHAMNAPLCDAEVCAPAPLATLTPPEADAPAETVISDAALDAAQQPIKASELKAETAPETAQPAEPTPRPRRKFLGLF